jgi:hypothetical protein
LIFRYVLLQVIWMMLPDIDFSAIRLHRKTQANAFEELCCQLARDEPIEPARLRFDRKGQGAMVA